MYNVSALAGFGPMSMGQLRTIHSRRNKLYIRTRKGKNNHWHYKPYKGSAYAKKRMSFVREAGKKKK